MLLIDNFLNKIDNLPMLPKVVQEVIALLNNDDVDLKQLSNLIEHDQVLSARVLRMANSAYFGCSRTINHIEDAVAVIGLSNLKTLVIASGVSSTFSKVEGLDLKRFWVHALLSASVARQLGKKLKLDAEAAYLGTLLHSIGQLPIHLVFPSAGKQVEEVCQGRNVLERKKVEQGLVGLDHCQVGEALAKLWNFPEEILRVVRYYADPMDEKACDLAPVAFAAVHIAFDLEHAKEATYIAETLNPEVAEVLGFNDQPALVEQIEICRPFVEEAKSYI